MAIGIHATQSILVGKLGAAAPSDLAGATTTSLYNATTGALNTSVGSVIAFRPVEGSGNKQVIPTSGQTVSLANTPSLQLMQRRDQSGDRAPLPERALEKSEVITPGCLYGIKYNGTSGSLPNNNVWTVGSINVTSETTYEIRTAADGAKVDQAWSHYNTPFDYSIWTSPDFTVAPYNAYTTAQKLDYVVKNLVNKYNVPGRPGLSVAFCLNLTNAGALSGSTTLAAIASLSVGDQIIIGYNADGSTDTITLTADLKQTFALMEAAYVAAGSTAGDVTIIPTAVASAYNTTNNPTFLPGVTTNVATTIGVVSLDYQQAFYDEQLALKTRLRLGLYTGFDDTVAKTELVKVSEGRNTGAQLLRMFEYEQDYKKYPSRKRWDALPVLYPNGIVLDAL